MKRLQAAAIAFLGILSLFCGQDVWAQKKDKKAPAKNEFAADAKDYASIQNLKEIMGTIQSSDGKSITLRIDIPHYEKNPNYKPPANNNNGGANNAMNQIHQHMARISQLQQQISHTKDPKARNREISNLHNEQNALNRAMASFQQAQAKAAGNVNKNPNNQPFKVVVDHKDFDLDFGEKVVVRKMFLESGYDDKGNLVEYNKTKIAELKGSDPKLPGFTAKFDDIQPGVAAKLMLVPVSTAAKATKEDNLVGAVDKPTVRMVILLQEKKDMPSGDKGKGK